MKLVSETASLAGEDGGGGLCGQKYLGFYFLFRNLDRVYMNDNLRHLRQDRWHMLYKL